jgi:hypothetical protein
MGRQVEVVELVAFVVVDKNTQTWLKSYDELMNCVSLLMITDWWNCS